MRWDNLRVDEEERRRLPGYREEAVVRRFDAPEALDTRFYEIRAKSALNRVPEVSQVPFRWTINPYRGCSHACTYCTSPETPILMADGRTRAIKDLDVGDRIVGTEIRGRYRRYVETEVRQHWEVLRPAFRVTLEDGTVLISSGDHRFLTRRGWKYVTGAQQGWNQRPHLTLNSELLGTGKFARAPTETKDYMRGYLCGIVRGDGHLRSRVYAPPSGRRPYVHHAFRLALAEEEALERAQEYMFGFGIWADRFQFAAGSAARRPIAAIRTQARDTVELIGELVRWPLSPSDDWRKGFLAGIFDAEGSCGRESAIRIANKDRAILDWTLACFRHFAFDVLEEGPAENGVSYVRLRGGLRERLRFFHTTDPAITRKRQVQGIALKSDARTRVVSIEPMGAAARMFDITTGTGDFISNGVVSHNCFARPTHKYLDLDAGRDFEKEIVVKVNVPEVLRTELARTSWKGEHVAMGTNTDPYQWVEGRYKLMRGIWEAMRDFANPCSILTKSPLLLRDIDLMKEVAEVAPLHANLSIPTMDEKAWRATEPHTPNPKARMEAVAALNEAGIPCGHPRRAAHAGDQRRARAGRADPRDGRGGGRDGHRGDRAAPARRRQADLHGLAALVPPRPGAAVRGPLSPRRLRAGAERKRLAEMVKRDELRGGTWPRDLRGVAAANGRAGSGPAMRAAAARAEAIRRAAVERTLAAERREREVAAAQQSLF
jgi:hypothetical protein